ncbi:MAG: hypothetical protein LIO37_03890 [Clostridiales bacterium]|nr:hypothetical protein [Clostridiales bacterium]
MSKKKRNLIVSGCAVVLAVSLALGGATYTYLSSMSESVTNTFNPNSVEIFLEESGDQEYEIIPGTSEEKDPTVTVTSTVDSYLYVLVYGNNPTFTYHDGTTYVNGGTIITYEIEDGWTSLAYDYDSDNDGTPDSYSDKVLANFVWAELTESDTTVTIYYREVSASDEEQVFHVLKDDVVSYSENIESLDGYEDGDIYLAFAAYAIQQKPFSSAADALTQTVVNTASGLTTAIAAGEAVTLSSSISVSASEINSAIDSADDSTAEIDLNGETLTIESGTISLVSGEAITLSNGTVEYTGTYNTVVSMYTGSE